MLCGNNNSLPAPDASVPCCMASAVTGGDSCTCWMPLLAGPRNHDVQEGPNPIRSRMCHDCAYRPGSPEREEGVPVPIDNTARFYCHDGIAMRIAQVHPKPDLAYSDKGDYYPIQRHDGPTGPRIWQANGAPALLCAGWAAHARAATNRERDTP